MRKSHKLATTVAGVLGLGTAVFFGTAGTGATLSDSGTGHVKVTSGAVTQTLSDANNTGTFALDFANLGTTGVPATDSVSIKTAGSLKMSTVIGQPLSNVSVDGLSAADLGKLSIQVKVNGTVVQDWTSATALPSTGISLGDIPVGATRTVTVSVKLVAGNEWKGKTVEGDVTVTSNEA